MRNKKRLSSPEDSQFFVLIFFIVPQRICHRNKCLALVAGEDLVGVLGGTLLCQKADYRNENQSAHHRKHAREEGIAEHKRENGNVRHAEHIH